jgi:outer membrane protein assembly factor BamB
MARRPRPTAAAFASIFPFGFAPILSTFVAAGAVLSLSGCGNCEVTVRQVSLAPIAAGGFDDIETDQSTHRLFMADQTPPGIDTVDLSSTKPRFIGTVAMSAAPNGLALAPDRKLLYAGLDGGTVAVVDVDQSSPTSMQVVDTFPVDMPTADLMDYNRFNQRLYVASGRGGQVVGVDTKTKQIIEHYNLKVSVEQPRFDPSDGMLYVTTPSTNTLHQFNPSTSKETRTYVLDGCRPKGLAINPSRQLAMVACRGSVAVLNLRSGGYEVTQAVPGADIVNYDAGADRFVIASPHGARDSSVGVFDGSGNFLSSVSAVAKTHAAVFDDLHGLVYAPGALGLMSFTPSACGPVPDWLRFAGGMSFFVVPILAAALFLFLYARRPRGPARKSFEQLQAEDLTMERERMRELEDAMLGPVVRHKLES